MSQTCPYSDLARDQCAHCRGDRLDVGASTPRRFDPAPRGRRIWPPERPETPTASTPPPPEEPTDDPKVQVARDLRAIGHMAAMLGERMLDLADDPHIVGGQAMVEAARVANLEAWQHQVDTDERQADLPARLRHAPYTSVADEDPDEAWPAYQTLRYWSEEWRRERGKPDIEMPSIATETRFLGACIDWAWSTEPHFEDFANDIRSARTKLENVVRDGIRETRSRILCDRCANPKRLIVKYGKAERPSTYKAPCCKAVLTADEAKRALAKQLRSSGVERWVTLTEAVGALRVHGWGEHTVRTWASGEDVETWRDEALRRTWCWWPDLWVQHLRADAERTERARRKAERAARRAACEAQHGEDCWRRGRCNERMGA